MSDPVTFFEQHAHMSQLSVVELLVAEVAMLEKPYFIEVEPDLMPYDGDAPYDGPLWTVTLYTVADRRRPKIAASMSGVACEKSDPYIRIVAAELAYDEIVAPWKKREGKS